MDIKPAGRKAHLKQYRAVNGKWQFVPVVKVDGKPSHNWSSLTENLSPQRVVASST
jgi:hypothetical protein